MMERDKQLSNAAEILESVMDHIQECLFLSDPDHQVLIYNRPMSVFIKETSGKDLNAGMDIRDYLIQPIKHVYLKNFSKVVSGEQVVFESPLTINNTSVWHEYRMNPIYSSTGELTGIAFWIKCIDEDKIAKIKAEEKLENLEAIFENANESIVLLDKEYKVMGFNKMARERLSENIKKRIYKGADFRDFIHPGREKVFADLFDNALRGIIGESEIHAIGINGKEVWFRSKLFPVYNKKGDLLGISLFVLNISERKKAEIALRESEEKFRKILESVPTPIIALNRDRKIVLSNPETEKVFGYSDPEVFGKDVSLLIPEWHNLQDAPASDRSKEEKNILRFGKDRSIKGISKDGHELIIEASVNNFQMNNELFSIVIIQDVTDHIKAEQKILDQYDKLQAIAREQSHEVRRPVASILGIVNVFKTVPDLTQEEKDLYLNGLFKVTNDLDNIIRKIVNYASYSGNEK